MSSWVDRHQKPNEDILMMKVFTNLIFYESRMLRVLKIKSPLFEVITKLLFPETMWQNRSQSVCWDLSVYWKFTLVHAWRVYLSRTQCLIEETEAHVIVRSLWVLLLLFLLSFSRGGGGCCWCGSCSSWGGSGAWTDVADQVLDVDAFESLGEEAGPVWLNINVGGLQESCDFLALKWK